jgi:hypothetical protein
VEEHLDFFLPAREYGVPESTLRDRTLGFFDADNCILGSKRTFAVEKEHQLAEHMSKPFYHN